MKRLWTLTAATIALLLLLSGPTLASAGLTNATMLALRDGLMAQENLALGTYPHYKALLEELNSLFNIRYSSFITRHSPFTIHHSCSKRNGAKERNDPSFNTPR